MRAVRPAKEKKTKKARTKLFSIRAGIDLPFLTIVLLLVAIGLVMLFSARYPYAHYNVGDSYYFIKQQSIWAALGITAEVLSSPPRLPSLP